MFCYFPDWSFRLLLWPAVREQNANAEPQTEARRILPLQPQVSIKNSSENLLKQQTGVAKPRLFQ